jgi:hypothetical protein
VRQADSPRGNAAAKSAGKSRCYYYLAEAWLQKGNFSEARQFNNLAKNYLKKDKDWKTRVANQADKIAALEK